MMQELATSQSTWLQARLGGQSHITHCNSVHGSMQGGDSRASQSHPSGSHLTSGGNTCPRSIAQCRGAQTGAEGTQFAF